MIRNIYRLTRKKLLHRIIPKSEAKIFPQNRLGVEVVGLFRSATGIGESARLCAQQLHQNGYKVRCISVEHALRKPIEIDWKFENTALEGQIGARIIHLNPPMLPPVILALGLKKFSSIFNIGYWAWELQAIPNEWRHSLRYINAVFTPSNFSTNAIKRESGAVAKTVPHPVTPVIPKSCIRADLGISENCFLASTVFGFDSALERKNPVATIRAFKSAFPKPGDAILILKGVRGHTGSGKSMLLHEIGDRSDIRLIDESWDPHRLAGLLAASDLYISLHRSEGFGLTIAEAMVLGTPVMVSNWSGNLDFCTAENSFLIPVRPVPVESDNPDFKELTDLVWADPDVGKAAATIRQIFEDRSIAAQKAAHCMGVTNAKFQFPFYDLALKELARKFNG